jgi:hypothetical protein
MNTGVPWPPAAGWQLEACAPLLRRGAGVPCSTIPHPPLDRRPVAEERRVYRFVHAAELGDPSLRDDCLSDRETGKRPFAREKAIPELQDGMSMFASLAAARSVWRDMEQIAIARGQPVRAGDFIAELVLRPGSDVELEDLGEVDEHLTVWGDPDTLVDAISAVYRASTSDE